jgi:hypothetical protein
MQTVVDVLRAAREKIADPKDWGQGLRRNRQNFETCCAAEAIEAVETKRQFRIQAFAEVLKHTTGRNSQGPITQWNDTNPHEVVLAAFDAAIKTNDV